MDITVYIAMYGWLAAAVLLFVVLPARKAMLTGLIAAWLFLPMAGNLYTLLQYTKINAVGLGLLIGVCLCDFGRVLGFRPRWFDVPAMLLMICPALSTFCNGQTPAYAGASTVNHVLSYGVPYLLGRIYFRTPKELESLSWALVAGGLIYVPLCVYEMRMSPQLHAMVYGFHQHDFIQTIRYGGYRPMVFMQHGLAVAWWMSATALAAMGLCLAGEGKRKWWLIWGLVALILTAVYCKSIGAVFLLSIGVIALLFQRTGLYRLIMIVLLLYVPVYMVARTAGVIKTDAICSFASQFADEERIMSMRGRLYQEDVLVQRGLEHPLVGWGPWGEFRANDKGEELVQTTDGMWIIMFGKFGLVGLAGFTLMLLLPVVLVAGRQFGENWTQRDFLVAGSMALIPLLYAVDCLMNAMPNPVFIVLAGALNSVATAGVVTVKSPRHEHAEIVRAARARRAEPALLARAGLRGR